MDAELCLGVLEVKDGCAARDTEDASDLPGRLTPGRPFEAFEFAGRQPHAVHKPIRHELATGMRVEIHRHELKHTSVLLDAMPEGGATLIGSKGNGGERPAAIMDRDSISAADPELGRLIEEPALRL